MAHKHLFTAILWLGIILSTACSEDDRKSVPQSPREKKIQSITPEYLAGKSYKVYVLKPDFSRKYFWLTTVFYNENDYWIDTRKGGGTFKLENNVIRLLTPTNYDREWCWSIIDVRHANQLDISWGEERIIVQDQESLYYYEMSRKYIIDK